MRKNTVYNSGIVFTATKVLCCKCNCQCGSQGEDRVVCVHNFPLIFLLLLLLMDALAESMLMEYAACMRSDIWDQTIWSEEDIIGMKKSILTLAAAAGEDVSSIYFNEFSIDALIDKFETGTEGRKKWKQRCKSKPKPGDHCCIEHIAKFESTATEGKRRTSRKQTNINLVNPEAQQENGDISEQDNDKAPNYVDIELLIYAAGFSEILESKPIAWQLLKMRSVNKVTPLTTPNQEISTNNESQTMMTIGTIVLPPSEARQRLHRNGQPLPLCQKSIPHKKGMTIKKNIAGKMTKISHRCLQKRMFS